MREKVTFDNSLTPFMDSLNEKVESYFRQKNIIKTGDWRLFSKTAIILPLHIVFYLLMIKLDYHPVFNWIASLLLGGTSALIGFNIMHDGSHGGYSGNKFLNLLMAYSMNLLGAEAYFWKTKHNVLHHTYTNIDGMDDDIAKHPLFRFCEQQEKKPFHRLQHFYWILFYPFTSIFWVYFTDFQKYFTGKIIDNYRYPKMNFWQHVVFWITKIVYTYIFIVLPIQALGVLPAIVCFVTMHFVLSIVLIIVFQLAHVVEGPSFASKEEKVIEKEWAIHQVETTANFATDNKIINWIVGGLNFQVEHHLFPKISHVHYPAISKFVQQTCSEFNVPYHNFNTFRSAVVSHVKHLQYLGVTA